MILDASAVLALLLDERSDIDLHEVVPQGTIGSVNYAEIVTRLSNLAVPAREIAQSVGDLHLNVVPLTAEVAHDAGLLRPVTKEQGLSLGDRCCLALARYLGRPVLTGEQKWTLVEQQVGVEVVLFRSRRSSTV